MTDVEPIKLCSLCAAGWHAEPDTEDQVWMGLTCPGENGTEQEKSQFLIDLKAKYDEEVALQEQAAEDLEDQADDLKEIWQGRIRNPEVTHEMLVEDVNVRVGTEVGRQKTAEVFQEAEFEIDVPHLTVPGRAPERPPMITTVSHPAKGHTSEDYLFFLNNGTEVPDNG